MPTTSPDANLSFLPWVRQGAAAAISTVDTLGPAQSAMADLTAALAINGAPLPPLAEAVAATVSAETADTRASTSQRPRRALDDGLWGGYIASTVPV